MKTITLHVTGMHCSACTVLIESELQDFPEVSSAKASLKHHQVEVTGDFGDKTAEHIARDLTVVVKKHGYELSAERKTHSVAWNDFAIAAPLALGFIAFFILLQKIGVVNLGTTAGVTDGTPFALRRLAPLS